MESINNYYKALLNDPLCQWYEKQASHMELCFTIEYDDKIISLIPYSSYCVQREYNQGLQLTCLWIEEDNPRKERN